MKGFKLPKPGAQKQPGQIKRSAFSRLPMKTRRSISGYLFILPFIIGFVVFMIAPLVMSIQMSFNTVTISSNGMGMTSQLGYDKDVTISKEIDLPETLRYNASKYEEGVFLVERVDEVLTLSPRFSYGPSVSLSREIALPTDVWFDPVDLAKGVYTVRPLKTALEMTNTFAMGSQIPQSREIELPKGLQYNALQKSKGLLAVEQINTLLTLPADFTFGPAITLAKEIKNLPEGYSYDEAQLKDKVYVVKADNGADIPLAFGVWLFDNGHYDALSAAAAAVQGGSAARLTKTTGYDKALYDEKGEFVVKLHVPLSYAVYLLNNGHNDLFCEAVAAAKGLGSAQELGLPEHFTYNKPLYTSKGTLTIQVPDEAANVPTSFAAHLISSGNADLFYETVDVVAYSDSVCSLYDPVYDASGVLTAIKGELPTDVIYDTTLFGNTGAIAIKLNNPLVPASFAGEILNQAGFIPFCMTLPDMLSLENYVHALMIEADFNRLLVEEITKMAIHTIAILVVAFVIAILLNQEFKGRALVRAIFFLPVILSSGVLVNLEANNTLLQQMQELASEQTPFTVTDSMMEILRLTGLGGDLLDIVFDLIAEVYDIVMASGIQIIVFLSGLQNVPASLYEAADVEGCTKWEAFWMITFPLVSPLLIVNIIYTIIDFFTKMGGDLTAILDQKMEQYRYDFMSAMSWIYFLVTLAMIGIAALIVSKVVAKDE
ncbi:MAG: sugar ABC transporter permease [Clostridia bacterium]|nr:sugar ABC transporter permease [Clostridia bacterium]